jgi:nitroreductase
VDTYLAVASKRDWRRFSDRPIPDEVVNRILDAGRLAGTASNRQPWRLILVENQEVRQRLAEAVYAAQNVQNAALVVALVGPDGRLPAFDAGRIAQNMFLTAWNEGVVSVPNGLADADRAAEILAVSREERPFLVLSFAYPARPRDPEGRSAEEWSAEAKRKPLDELLERR